MISGKTIVFLAIIACKSMNAGSMKIKKDPSPIPTEKTFVLITSLYNEVNENRVKEFIACLEKNIVHDRIKKIHVVYDTSKDDSKNVILSYLRSKKVEISYIVGRPTFSYLFQLANQLYANKRIIVSNADIYFNDTLKILDNYSLAGKFLALTRWNVKDDGSIAIFKQYDKFGEFRPEWSYFSQDTWIFKAPVKKIDADAILLGTFLCDSKIAFQAYQTKLHVYNPCFSIQCCHLHLSGVRNYEKIPNKMAQIMAVPWTTIDE